MKNKLKLIYDGIAKMLCSIPSDKWVHLFVGVIVSAFVAVFLHRVVGSAVGASSVMGILAAACVGLLKESLDTKTSYFDALDLGFTIIGGVLAALIYSLS